MNPSYCPISYSSSSVPTIADTQVVVLNPASRTFTVKSNDLSLAGTYTITVTALSPNGVALTTPTLSFPKLSFLLNLVDPCKTATLTINSTIIQAMTTYILADPEFSFPVLDLTKITSSVTTLATCPALQIDILTNTNGAIDSSVFTFPSNILKVYTTDGTKVTTYNLKLKVKYTGASYTNSSSLNFTVNVIASCTTVAITINDTKFKADTLGFTITQSIWQSRTIITWKDSIVAVKDVLGNSMNCGSLVYEFLNSD